MTEKLSGMEHYADWHPTSQKQLESEHQEQAESALIRLDTLSTYEVPPLLDLEAEKAMTEQARQERIIALKELSEEELQLLSAEVRTAVAMEAGENDTVVLHLGNDKMAIFKASSGEVFMTPKIEPGTYYLRERSAYLVSDRLNLDMVPTTVIREIDGKVGSLQDFRSEAKMGSEVDLDELSEELYKLWVFDYLIWNPDRGNPRNFLVEGDSVLGIDHGLAFGSHFTPHKAFPEMPAPESLRQSLELFVSDLDRQEALLEELMELLPQDQAMACLRRIQHVARKLASNGSLTTEDLEFNPRGW